MGVPVERGFLSYARADDEADDGRITRLHATLERKLHAAAGRSIPIFLDHVALEWGAAWEQCIDDGIDRTMFVIALLSPSFFASTWCRRELTRFIERERTLGEEPLVFPILWRPIDEVSEADRLGLDRWLRDDWTARKYVEPDSAEVQRALDTMGSAIARAVAQRSARQQDRAAAVPARLASFPVVPLGLDELRALVGAELARSAPTGLRLDFDVELDGRDGPSRFDAVARITVGPAEVLIVIGLQVDADVDRDALQLLQARASDVGANKVLVATTQRFTTAAVDFATRRRIALLHVADAGAESLVRDDPHGSPGAELVLQRVTMRDHRVRFRVVTGEPTALDDLFR